MAAPLCVWRAAYGGQAGCAVAAAAAVDVGDGSC